MQVQSPEVCYTEYMVKIMFDDQDLNDPTIVNEQVLEDAILGSQASYRNKAQVRLIVITTAKRKLI